MDYLQSEKIESMSQALKRMLDLNVKYGRGSLYIPKSFIVDFLEHKDDEAINDWYAIHSKLKDFKDEVTEVETETMIQLSRDIYLARINYYYFKLWMSEYARPYSVDESGEIVFEYTEKYSSDVEGVDALIESLSKE